MIRTNCCSTASVLLPPSDLSTSFDNIHSEKMREFVKFTRHLCDLLQVFPTFPPGPAVQCVKNFSGENSCEFLVVLSDSSN